MDHVNLNIARNLKRIRKAKNMSLDVAAEQTGVSKSMLARIERGEANPSIGCLVKVSSGLRITLKQLIDPPREAIHHIVKGKVLPSKQVEGQYTIFTYFPYENNQAFEIYGIELDPLGEYYSGSHGEKTMEYLTVTRGILRLKLSGVTYEIKPGDAFRFDSDVEHWYCNDTDEKTVVIVVFTFH